MKLAEALFPEVPYGSRTRGVVYFERGAVTRFHHEEGEVDAVVRGTEPYRVRLEAGVDLVRGSCTCPYFAEHLHPCKHIWALVLACDSRQVALLPAAAVRRGLGFEAIDPAEDLDEIADAATGWRLGGPSARSPRAIGARRSGAPAWKQVLTAIGTAPPPVAQPFGPPVPGRLLYVVDLAASQQNRTLVIHLMTQDPKRNGDWGVPKAARLGASTLQSMPPEDRDILERLTGARPAYTWAWGSQTHEVPSPFLLRGALAAEVFPVMCQTGRCRLAATQAPAMRPQDSPITPLPWDDGPPWSCQVHVQRDESAGAYVLTGELHRESGVLSLTQAILLLQEGLVLTWTAAARLLPANALPWMDQLRVRERLVVPFDGRDLLRTALLTSQPPTSELPEELRVEIREGVPRPRLSIRALRHDSRSLAIDVSFDYGGAFVSIDAPVVLAPTAAAQVVVRRDRPAEQEAMDRLYALGVRSAWTPDGHVPQMAATQLSRIVRVLVAEGWRVEAEGRRYRLASEGVALDVRSGIDWFELHGEATFDDQRVGLPALLAALERGEGSIALDDGTIGILPEDWLRTYGALGIGVREGEGLRFKTSQIALLDALLAARPAVSWDETFANARRRLHDASGIAALDPPLSFAGVLREYQREGLGWMASLRALGFGGCLADDMGLGKTVMVLALLDARRQERVANGEPRRPSLVVAPRSVVFNWQQEAARFTPELRVLDHSHATRAEQHDRIPESDVVLTTYGALRRDAPRLSEQAFDYIVLDEAQTIKNAGTVTAKAARLLNGANRLALSGTPVENRLADLWSLFEFLNPGLLSNASRFAQVFSGKDVDPESLKLLAQGLRPFILRRTKEQVASELPPKTEQTILCELDRHQRKLYDELRDHYRQRLLHGNSTWQRSKFQVLEALLRLRQVACHPGLVDAERSGDASAKLDLLVPRLVEAIEEDHKTLVFSQFTSFLNLLRSQLNAKGIAYEYLDGKTRDREARVERFQTDPDCRLFLISLKAGGLGLNLTAADYVFLLDPWWNPAAEAQAIDRTHRIGQLRRVFAYRLIAKDTVEERVVELQQRKRALVDAIMTEDNSVMRNLRREDLELLLS